MKKKKIIVKDKEKVILQYMDEVGGTATPNNIAENTGISYVTVKKYIKKLLEEGILEIDDGEEKKDSKKK